MFNIPESMYFESKLIDDGVTIKPRMAIIHNSYKCNQACKYCFFHDYNIENQTSGKVMPIDKLTKLIDELSVFGLKSVQFCGGGEPLICENMNLAFDRVGARGLSGSLITNGVLLTGKVMESAVTNCSWIRVGLDTVSPYLYKLIRGTDDCGLVLENIKKMLHYRKNSNSNCEISIKICLYKGVSLDTIQDVFSYFKDSGIDNIQVKHVWDKEGDYYNTSITKENIGALNAYDNQVVRKVHYAKYMNEPCWLTPMQTTIDCRGNVYLCCYYQGRDEEHKIGNVFEKPFEEIWNSQYRRDKIKKIKMKECLKHDCRFQKYMATIRKYQKHKTLDFV